MTDKKTVHTLEIVSVTLEDSGQYAVYVSNALGAAYSSARLLVRGGFLKDWAELTRYPIRLGSKVLRSLLQ